MKKIYILFFMIFTNNAFCQNFDDLLYTANKVDCSDISYNASLYFVKYMTENKIDSAKNLLNYWEIKCGMLEPILRAKILLALKENNFNDSILGNNVLYYIFNYQSRMNMIQKEIYYEYDTYKQYYGFVPPAQEFDTYTCNLATDLKEIYDSESVEHLLAEFYSDGSDSIFLKLQQNKYEGTVLYSKYSEALNSALNRKEWHIAFFTGTWIPTGNLNSLGVHPELGLLMGFKYKKYSYDVTMSFKFINAPNKYYVKRKNSEPQLTKHFMGGNIGIDIGRDIYARKKHEIQLIAGAAFDGFEVIKEDKDKDIKSLNVNSYNFNIGFGYRYYINDWYIGLRAKYNFVDYTLGNVVDFTGNPITINIVIGGLSDIFRNSRLESLKYKVR
ncbi:MAG: hypothetical protein LBK94_05300 [Prevotellaceae bacterium]|nr:hypothetical protein [Prevotellaceae bacterium]